MTDHTNLIFGEALCILYLSSFISQILDFLYRLVSILIFDGLTVKQRIAWCFGETRPQVLDMNISNNDNNDNENNDK